MAVLKKLERISSVEKLEYIKEHVCKIDIMRIEAFVCSMRKNSDIEGYLRIFSDVNNAFALGEEDLMDKEHHNEHYANVYNNKYNTAYYLLKEIKGRIYGLYSLMDRSAAKSRIPLKHIPADTKSIEWKADHSVLGNMPYMGYLFEDETPCQQRLLTEIYGFLNTLGRNIDRCKSIVEEEKRIGNDVEECYALLDKQIEEIFNMITPKKCKVINTEYYNDLIQADKEPKFATKWWHKLTPKELTHVAIGLWNERMNIYTKTERKAFCNNRRKIERFRKMVLHLINASVKITGEVMVYAQKYSNCPASQSAFHSCFVETYNKLGGTQKIITYPRYNQAYTKYGYRETDKYHAFQDKMDLSLA